MLLLALCTAAIAGDPAEVPMPELNAQAYRPSIDSQATLWTDDVYLDQNGARPTLRLSAGWARNPLVVVWDDGDTTALVRDAVNLDLLAGVTLWRVRAGLDLPLYLLSTSDKDAGGAGLGDMAIDLRGAIITEEEKAPLGLALNVRMGLPTATVDTALGSPGLTSEIGLIASKHLGDLLLAANLGTRIVPETQLLNVEVDDQLYYRVGGGYALTDAAGASLELAGHLNYNEPFGNPAANPHEALLGGWFGLTDALVLRAGVGRGLTRGIASPDVRVVASLGWEPIPEGDADGDGIVDSKDQCPEQPEDADGWEDRDGCPDPSALLTVKILDEAGAPVEGAQVIVTGPQGFEGGPQASGDLHPGTYRVEMSAPGFEPVDQEVVMAADDQEITVALVAKPAVLQVVITGPDGQPMDAKYSIGKGELADTEGGRVELTLDAGKHLLTVRAEGYAVDKQKLALDRGETELVEIQLRPTQVQLTVEKIEIKGEVFFDVNQATIKAESHPLLEEVAQVMLDHPEVLRLRIEGHTDSRGDAGYNLELSKKRSAAVKDFLIAKGVEEGRLESEGFGESKPLEKGENEAAWSKNRRVDFFIAERTEAKPVKKKAE